MPTLTLTLTDEEQERLAQVAAKRRRTPAETVLYVLRRDIIRRSTDPPERPPTRPRQADRLARQLRLLDHIRQHGWPDGLTAKRQLAAQLGIYWRTMYRDLEMLQAAGVTDATGPR